jgi:hypothetical protein
MKKIILFIAILAMPFYAHSQNLSPSSAELSVSAQITAAVELTKITDLDFGQYGAGDATPTIVADPTGTNTNVAGSVTRGQIDFTSTGTVSFKVGMSGDDVTGTAVTLYEDDPDAPTISLTANLSFYWVGLTSTAVTLNTTEIATKDDTVPADEGTGSLYIGGSLNAVGTVPVDSYSKTVTITLEAL